MICQLEEHEYESIRLLCRDHKSNLVVDSVIDQNTPAWVFVDQKRKPGSALIWDKQDALLLAGYAECEEFNVAIGDTLVQRIIPDAQRRYVPEMTIYYASDAWEARLEVILQGRNAEKASRRYYAFTYPNTAGQKQMPLDCEMRRIDEVLLGNAELGNIAHVRGWVGSFWHSYRDFANTGIGYCLVKKDSIVSWCLSVFVSGSNREFGLATVPEERMQGHATLVAMACVKYCYENGLTPHWHCWNDNRGSIAVAEKVGFEKPTIYYAYKLSTQ
ncbi:GNAT family N-acetyltransferase [Chloroflexota bacterium]